MSEGTRWLGEREMAAWRSYVVAGLLLRQRLHRELADQHEISLTDYEVLVVLADYAGGEPMRMSELATRLGATKSRLSHQIARMESEGRVRRGRDPEDKRGVTAAITPAGRAALAAAAPTHVGGVRAHFIDLLTAEEQQVIGRAFDRIYTQLGGPTW